MINPLANFEKRSPQKIVCHEKEIRNGASTAAYHSGESSNWRENKLSLDVIVGTTVGTFIAEGLSLPCS